MVFFYGAIGTGEEGTAGRGQTKDSKVIKDVFMLYLVLVVCIGNGAFLLYLGHYPFSEAFA